MITSRQPFFSATLNGGSDACVFRLDRKFENLVYSTFIGGPTVDLWDIFDAIHVDSAGTVTAVGRSDAGFPTTPGAFNETFKRLVVTSPPMILGYTSAWVLRPGSGTSRFAGLVVWSKNLVTSRRVKRSGFSKAQVRMTRLRSNQSIDWYTRSGVCSQSKKDK